MTQKQRNKSPVSTRYRLKDNTKVIIKETGCEDVDQIQLA